MEASAWLELFFPSKKKCPLCRGTMENYLEPVCKKCIQEITSWKQDFRPCTGCGRLLPLDARCLQCAEHSPSYAAARSVGPYGGIIKQAAYKLKFGGNKKLAFPLGRMMAEVLLEEDWQWDCMIPVPLDSKRLRERGFNQAELLAREIGRQLRKTTDVGILFKKRHTQAQAKLSREERLKNLKGSFDVVSRQRIKAKNILLVDDILTTGATAEECTRILLRAGAKSVKVITFATGIQKSSKKSLK